MVIPYGNKKDLKELPTLITSHIDVVPVKWIDEVLKLALVTSA